MSVSGCSKGAPAAPPRAGPMSLSAWRWPASCSAIAAMLFSGCATAPAGPSVLVLPGAQKTPPQFQADQAGCQQQAQSQVAPSVDAANQQAAATAVVGTAIGAAVGALIGYGSGYYGYRGGYHHHANPSAAWGAGAGLMYGSAVGGSVSQAANAGLQQRYDNAFAQCMVLRGNHMPGMAGYRRPAPALPPPPPGYVPPSYGAPPAVPPPDTPPPAGVRAPA